MNQPLLDPRNDFVFKRLFAKSLPLLTDLINSVRQDDPPIVVTSVQNPQIEPDELKGKYIVLDILAKDQDDHILNVEMQMSRQQAWSERSMVYLAKMLAGQLKAGDQYANLKPVIGIHFLAYDLFEAQNQAIWCFEMRDRNLPAVRLGRELQLNIVELKKAARLTRNASSSNQADTALSAWIKYFAFWKDETIMNQIAHPPVLEAMQGLRALSADEEARRMADVRERAILAERTEIESALARGKAIGKAEGKAEGKVEAKLEALAAMIASGIGEAQAKAILGMA